MSRSFLLLWLGAAIIGVLLASQPAHPEADVTHYKFWARLATTQGVAASYSGVYPESYTIYPPVTMYGLGLVGRVYQALADPEFDRERALDSQRLTVAIRLMALSVHLVAGLVLYRLLAGPAGAWRASVYSGLYLLNPGALWDLAVWGQPDSWHALFALLGMWSIATRQALVGGAWLGLAAMTKPQAWVIVPLGALALLRLGGLAGAALGGLAAATVALLVLLPFVLAGTLPEFLTLPGQISSVMPVASANAHNLWWLVTRGAVPFVFDNQPLASALPITYRQAALLLVGATLAISLWLTWRARGPWELCGLAAYSTHAWFVVTTGAHENHPFMIFPFLCLVAWRTRFLSAVLALLMVTFSFNVLVHDIGLAPYFDDALGTWGLRLQMLASGLNLSILAAWTVWLARGGSTGDEAGQGNKP